MGEMVELTAMDGHVFNAYVSKPDGDTKGAVVIIQEIFGINAHMKSVCDRYASLGYTAITPALFDRIQKNIELEYTAEGIAEGLEYKKQCDDNTALNEIAASARYVSDAGKVSVIGYCWGGTLAYLAAGSLDGIFKAVGYYGGGIVSLLNKPPQIPTLLHFGEQDHSISMTDVEKITKALPAVKIYTYPAGHGFSCDARGSYDKDASNLALERTLAFLEGA